MARRKFEAIGSTADIAFLLLCYFLMTTTMGSQTGLSRRLPPMPDKDQKVEDQKVNRRNIIVVKINSSDRILAGADAIDVSQLKDKIKEFLSNPANDPKSIIRMGIVVVAIAAVVLVAYLLAKGNPIPNSTVTATPGELKLTDTILTLTAIAGVGAILAIIVGEIRLAITNKK